MDVPGSGDVAEREDGRAAAPSAAVITVSTRAAAGIYPDASGPALAEALRALGFVVDGPRVVADGDPVGAALRAALAQGHDLVVTAGGTGLTADDVTPEQTRPLLDRLVPGLSDAVRAAGAAAGAPASLLSRGVAGVSGRALVMNLPGSVRAVRESLAAVGPALQHAVDQLRGGDHTREDLAE